MSEVIDLGELKGDNISLNIDDKLPSVNFGSGIELLMNDKRKGDTSKNNSDININDLDDLEKELKHLDDDFKPLKSPSKSNLFKSMLENNNLSDIKLKSQNNSENDENEENTNPIPENDESIKIGQATANNYKDTTKSKTWDGFGKFNNIPLDPDKDI